MGLSYCLLLALRIWVRQLHGRLALQWSLSNYLNKAIRRTSQFHFLRFSKADRPEGGSHDRWDCHTLCHMKRFFGRCRPTQTYQEPRQLFMAVSPRHSQYSGPNLIGFHWQFLKECLFHLPLVRPFAPPGRIQSSITGSIRSQRSSRTCQIVGNEALKLYDVGQMCEPV